MSRRFAGLRKPLVALGLAAAFLLTVAPPAQAVDQTAPQINFRGTQYLLGTLLSDSTSNPSVPTRQVWGAYDPSGVCFQSASLYNYATGSWSYPSVRKATNYFVRVDVRPNSDYYLSIYSRDCSGNAGTRNFYFDGGDLHQEGEASLSPGWTTANCLCWSAGNVVHNYRAGAKASFSFYGRSIAWITDKAPSRGTAYIYIDGVYQKSVNLQGEGVNRIVGYEKRFRTYENHIIDIVVAGTAGHPRVDVDAFVVE